jgi:hypothetical protein
MNSSPQGTARDIEQTVGGLQTLPHQEFELEQADFLPHPPNVSAVTELL